MNIKNITTSSSSSPVDYFTDSATAEIISKDSPGLPYTLPIGTSPRTTAVSSVSQVNEQPYQQLAHSVVIRRYAIKRT
mgnify:CR=1 FL=1